MKIVIDANIVIAVVLDEPERDWAIGAAEGHEAVAPRSLPFEIGNALSKLVKRKLLPIANAQAAWHAAATFRVTLRDIDLAAAVQLAAEHDIYAYDAYMLQCAREAGAKLLTLDKRMLTVARQIGLKPVER